MGNTLTRRWHHVGNALATCWQHIGNILATSTTWSNAAQRCQLEETVDQIRRVAAAAEPKMLELYCAASAIMFAINSAAETIFRFQFAATVAAAVIAATAEMVDPMALVI